MIDHRYLFIGGLHRSGTSLVARLCGRISGVASIEGAPVPENEGVYLQGGIPHTAQDGRPMHFATDPAQHLIEGCRLDRLETRERMEADWAPWFPPAPWRVEKSPVNLTRMRLYQQLFPLSQFIVVMRHPELVAAAVSKWVDTPSGALIDHWLEAHQIVAHDIAYLHSVLVVRYEDVVADPARTLSRIAAFIDRPAAPPGEDLRDGNREYRDHPVMTSSQAEAAEVWGYGPGGEVRAFLPVVRHPLRAVAEAVRAV
ncbi:sulfotransferase family protein [Tropicimonas isoalkanivorans]|uniref:Sulfotransferase family protein n=1 Tax=Tropicimonas isoalkanivorans TaxID=441112 RepID=A0A1I1HGV5_9RHOB|nr:sulfotransferase [Tropicimonas isoalkanivorans]SFC21218.1 Sulfotransferase family protein [Tropicimonas isoalkanivorans]